MKSEDRDYQTIQENLALCFLQDRNLKHRDAKGLKTKGQEKNEMRQIYSSM